MERKKWEPARMAMAATNNGRRNRNGNPNQKNT
jgi:hypothetical protein